MKAKQHPFLTPEQVRDMYEMDQNPWADVPDEFWEPKPGEVWEVWDTTCLYIMQLPEPTPMHLVFSMFFGELALFPYWPKESSFCEGSALHDVSDWQNLNFPLVESLDSTAGP